MVLSGIPLALEPCGAIAAGGSCMTTPAGGHAPDVAQFSVYIDLHPLGGNVDIDTHVRLCAAEWKETKQ